MKIGVLFACAALLALTLLSGCPKNEGMADRANDPSNLQTTPDPSQASSTEGAGAPAGGS